MKAHASTLLMNNAAFSSMDSRIKTKNPSRLETWEYDMRVKSPDMKEPYQEGAPDLIFPKYSS